MHARLKRFFIMITWTHAGSLRILIIVGTFISLVTLIVIIAKPAPKPTDHTYIPEVLISKTATNLRASETQTTTSSTPEPPVRTSGFITAMREFPWDDFSVGAADQESARVYVSRLIGELVEFDVVEPTVGINQTCMAPPALPDPAKIDCSSFGSAFGDKRDHPAKVAHMIQLGFEVDTLEIHLRELYDVVDYFFILESTRAHLRQVRKPLVWDHIKDQDRFRLFQDKVVHMVIDDIEALPNAGESTDMWYLERLQEDSRFNRFLEWNAKNGNLFGDEDVIGFGDADEVTWRQNVYNMKHCTFKASSIDIGIWFPMGRTDHAFKPDWTVQGHPYSLGDPTFYSIKSAKASQAGGHAPNRKRGTSPAFLLGGMHMTRHRYVPFMMLEPLTCTECSVWSSSTLTELKDLFNAGSVAKLQEYWDRKHTEPFTNRIVPIASLGAEADALQKIPWFLACNRERYPYWWGEPDTRLD
jgi:hypothetical protein